jgi:arsenate reductase
MAKPKVGFVCTHNSCRSQIAEALGRHLAGDAFESYSAGTDIEHEINLDAVRLMRLRYGIDMPAEGTGRRGRLRPAGPDGAPGDAPLGF